MILRTLKRIGEIPLILAHMGGWKNWDRVEMLAATGVYLDTAFSLGKITSPDGYYSDQEAQMLESEQFCRIVRAFGSERILFGTDSPWADQQKALSDLSALPLSEEEKEKILGQNALRILK
jgi:predicted TIM-barrel fold metal-dependent hydrolase